MKNVDFLGGSVVKNLPANVRGVSLILGSGRFCGEGNGNPLQYSCLENPRDGGAWWAAVYGAAQSRTQLKRLSSSSSSYDVAQTVKRLPAMRILGFDPRVGKIPWRRKWQPTPVLLPGKSHGRRSLVGYIPWGCKELDITEQLHFSFFI